MKMSRKYLLDALMDLEKQSKELWLTANSLTNAVDLSDIENDEDEK